MLNRNVPSFARMLPVINSIPTVSSAIGRISRQEVSKVTEQFITKKPSTELVDLVQASLVSEIILANKDLIDNAMDKLLEQESVQLMSTAGSSKGKYKKDEDYSRKGEEKKDAKKEKGAADQLNEVKKKIKKYGGATLGITKALNEYEKEKDDDSYNPEIDLLASGVDFALACSNYTIIPVVVMTGVVAAAAEYLKGSSPSEVLLRGADKTLGKTIAKTNDHFWGYTQAKKAAGLPDSPIGVLKKVVTESPDSHSSADALAVSGSEQNKSNLGVANEVLPSSSISAPRTGEQHESTVVIVPPKPVKKAAAAVPNAAFSMTDDYRNIDRRYKGLISAIRHQTLEQPSVISSQSTLQAAQVTTMSDKQTDGLDSKAAQSDNHSQSSQVETPVTDSVNASIESVARTIQYYETVLSMASKAELSGLFLEPIVPLKDLHYSMETSPLSSTNGNAEEENDDEEEEKNDHPSFSK